MMLLRGGLLLCLLSPVVFAGTLKPLKKNAFQLYLVNVLLNDKEQPHFYHCYIDSDNTIWMSQEELQQLGFPENNEEPFLYQQRFLYQLNAYEGMKVMLDTRSLILSIHTPIHWERVNVLSDVRWYNGKIRPAIPGFFLIMISLIVKLISLTSVMQQGLASLAILIIMVWGPVVFYSMAIMSSLVNITWRVWTPNGRLMSLKR